MHHVMEGQVGNAIENVPALMQRISRLEEIRYKTSALIQGGQGREEERVP